MTVTLKLVPAVALVVALADNVLAAAAATATDPAGAGDRTGDRIGGRHGLAAGGLQGHAERFDPGVARDERVIGRAARPRRRCW